MVVKYKCSKGAEHTTRIKCNSRKKATRIKKRLYYQECSYPHTWDKYIMSTILDWVYEANGK